MTTHYTEIADYLDQKFLEGNVKPLNVILDILENHVLEDGVCGEDEYQDTVAQAWKLLINAYKMEK